MFKKVITEVQKKKNISIEAYARQNVPASLLPCPSLWKPKAIPFQLNMIVLSYQTVFAV